MFEIVKWLLQRGQETGTAPAPLVFTIDWYQRHNRRRQEHLASLDLPIPGKSVLELGAGIGDHTSFFLDRGCSVTLTDGREDNLEVMQVRYPSLPSFLLDMETCEAADMPAHQIVYAYGLLYHLSDPARAISLFSHWTTELLLLQTGISFGDEMAINLISEDVENASQATSGTGNRPTRAWLRAELQKHFDYVYMPLTQPWNSEFPIDWSGPAEGDTSVMHHAVFIASRTPLTSAKLTLDLPEIQGRS